MIEAISMEWKKSLTEFLSTPFFRRLSEGTLTLQHYQALLRETYYNTRENPPSFALMTWHLKGRKQEVARKIYRHCSAEYGHHELALNDLRAMGVDVSNIPAKRPLPTTEALIAFAVYNIQHGNPLAYLGYVFHLEMLPATLGMRFISELASMGVPPEAMTFLTEHSEADQGHTRWLEEYFRDTVETSEDLEAIIHGAVGSCKLHGVMLQGVLDSVNEGREWTPIAAKFRASPAKPQHLTDTPR